MDPEVVHGEEIERPEVTLERTRELLARSRATLAIADRQLSHHEHTETLLTASPSDPSTAAGPQAPTRAEHSVDGIPSYAEDWNR